MRSILHGYKTMSFADKETGELIKGVNLYISHPDPEVIGSACQRIFVKESNYSNVLKIEPKNMVGKEIYISIGFNNKIVEIKAI